jgi:DNA repair protein RecO (recombination protein O)
VGDEGLLSRADGGVYPASAAPEAPRRASRAALRAYAVFARADLDTVMRMELETDVRREVEALVRAFLRYHVEEAYPDRGQEVIAQIERASPHTPPAS